MPENLTSQQASDLLGLLDPVVVAPGGGGLPTKYLGIPLRNGLVGLCILGLLAPAQ